MKDKFEGKVEDKIMDLFLKMTKLKKFNQESIDQYTRMDPKKGLQR